MVISTSSSLGTVMNDVQLTDLPLESDDEWTPRQRRAHPEGPDIPHEWTRRERRNGMTIGAQLSLRTKQDNNKVDVKYDLAHDGALDWTNINVILQVCFANIIIID